MDREHLVDIANAEGDRKNSEALLSGPLKQMLWHCLEHSPEVKLYAIGAGLDRTNGDGELRLSSEGDPCIQIKIGKSWKVVEMPDVTEQIAFQQNLRVIETLSPTQRPIPSRITLSGYKLYLDPASLELVRRYKIEYEAAEEKKAIARAQARPPRFNDDVVSRPKEQKVENEFKKILKKYGLAEVDMHALQPAVKLIDRILKPAGNPSAININTEEGQKVFCAEWRQHCGKGMPLPFVPPEEILRRFFPAATFPKLVDRENGSLGYVNFLLSNNVVYNVAERDVNNQSALPRFGSGMDIYVMDWQEADSTKINLYGTPVLESAATSRLLESLGITGVFATRTEIDVALWAGDPADREPSEAQKAVLKDMGLEPAEWMLRLIDYGEYARLAEKNGWGKTALRSHFDGYIRDENDPNKKRHGLSGGHVDFGGASHIHFANPRKDKLAVRLILERRRLR